MVNLCKMYFCSLHEIRSLCKALYFLISEIYGKVVVASKVPLPNYRPDLDDKRPQREVLLLYIDNILCKLFFFLNGVCIYISIAK